MTLGHTMRALICHQWGGVDELTVGEAPVPEAAPGEVLIRVKATSVNYADSIMVAGRYQTKPALPYSPGLETAGVVAACGRGVSGFKPRDRVMAILAYGGLAEFAAAPAAETYVIPDGMSFAEAGAFPIACISSHVAIRWQGRLEAGETLLVLGAAGGVGLAAVEIGKAMGARVIAAASTPERLAVAVGHAADASIDYSREQLTERLMARQGRRRAGARMMEIRLTRHDRHVAIVTIDHQRHLNAMTRQMLAELGRLWDELERDGGCRCIILTGAGLRAFTVGADVSGDLSAGPEVARMVNHAWLKNDPYSKPIIAAVNGDCVGGGLELMLSTDIRAAVPEARFGLPEVKWSIYPFGGSTHQADPADRLRSRHGSAADGAIDRCRAGGAVGAGKPASGAGRADGLGDRDRGDDCCEQRVSGAGGQAAGQHHDRRSRADTRGSGATAWRQGAGESAFRRGHRRVPREAPAAL
jgi:D-arabinose 1-dehydrogenase-like Zn-dependent alcohol dehydrogenase